MVAIPGFDNGFYYEFELKSSCFCNKYIAHHLPSPTYSFFKALWQHINGLERWLSAEEYLLLFQGPKFSSQHPHLVVHGYP